MIQGEYFHNNNKIKKKIKNKQQNANCDTFLFKKPASFDTKRNMELLSQVILILQCLSGYSKSSLRIREPIVTCCVGGSTFRFFFWFCLLVLGYTVRASCHLWVDRKNHEQPQHTLIMHWQTAETRVYDSWLFTKTHCLKAVFSQSHVTFFTLRIKISNNTTVLLCCASP